MKYIFLIRSIASGIEYLYLSENYFSYDPHRAILVNDFRYRQIVNTYSNTFNSKFYQVSEEEMIIIRIMAS